MKIIRNAVSTLKQNASNKIASIKKKAQQFKQNVSEAKSKPRSKRKSLLLGFTTVITIFGVALLAPVLPAMAQDVPPNPTDFGVAPTSKPSLVPTKDIVDGFAGAATTICALAVSSGSFVVGAVCGIIGAVGILIAQRK